MQLSLLLLFLVACLLLVNRDAAMPPLGLEGLEKCCKQMAVGFGVTVINTQAVSAPEVSLKGSHLSSAGPCREGQAFFHSSCGWCGGQSFRVSWCHKEVAQPLPCSSRHQEQGPWPLGEITFVLGVFLPFHTHPRKAGLAAMLEWLRSYLCFLALRYLEGQGRSSAPLGSGCFSETCR